MYYYEKENKYVIEGTEFELDGVKYPPQFFTASYSTPEEIAAVGLVEVKRINEPANGKYYWVAEHLDGAELSYTNTPKDLAEVKANEVKELQNIAYTTLLPSDWMVVKAFETATEIPADWKTWRGEVRAYVNTVVDQINAATDVADVEATMKSLVWPIHD